MSLLVRENPRVLWQDAVRDAECRCLVHLDGRIENYLITLLTRYTDKPDMVKRVFATALLEAMERGEAERDILLQRVGDECLLFSGLFPKSAAKRNVGIAYYVDIGRSAYANISATSSSLFENLATEFVPLMDVLQSMKSDIDLMPIEAYEQWQQLGSQYALTALRSYCAKR